MLILLMPCQSQFVRYTLLDDKVALHCHIFQRVVVIFV